MREMKDSGFSWLGFIPDNWDIKKVKHCFYRKNKKAMQNDPVILSLARSGVKVRDISNNEGQMAESYFNYNPVDIDDLLLNPMDLYSGANCSISKVKGVISPAYVNLRALDGINPVFFDYYFKVQYWLMAFFSYGKGVSFDNRWTLNAETLMNYPVIVPSYAEQRKIADYLDDKCSKIDAIIAKQEKIIEKIKLYKSSLIMELVLGGLHADIHMKDSGYDFIGAVPSTWSVMRLRNIGTLQNGISKGGEFFGQGFPFVSYGDVYRNFKLPESVPGLVDSTEEEREKYSVREGAIFFTRTSETIEEVGFSCVCEKTIADATFAGFLIRVRPKNDILYTGYAKYYFRSNHLREYLVKEMNLVTRASLGQDLLKSMPVLIPPKEEQIEIANYLDQKCESIDKQVARREQLISKLTEYKKSLIYECVTGKKEII